LIPSDERARSASFSLTALRLALGPTIVALAAARVPGPALAAVLLVAALSDIFDGIVLRRAGVDAPDLRRWDSIADTIFYLGAAAAAFLTHRDALWVNAPFIMIVMGTQAVGHILEVSRFGRAASYHAWSGRVWGWAIAIAFLGLFAFGSGLFLTVALVCGLVSQLDNMAITLILPELRSDVRSVVHALRIRRDAETISPVSSTTASEVSD
jgi:phosphatidylserine synthase